MSARTLSLLATGVALLIAGCSGGSDASSAGPVPAATSGASGSSGSSGSDASSEAKPSTEPVGDDAVGRYETYLHAIGNEDVTTACEIGRIAEERGRNPLGPCEHSMDVHFNVYSTEEKDAMLAATVDRSRITKSSTSVEIPAEAVKVPAGVDLNEAELADAEMELRDGKWYRVR